MELYVKENPRCDDCVSAVIVLRRDVRASQTAIFTVLCVYICAVLKSPRNNGENGTTVESSSSISYATATGAHSHFDEGNPTTCHGASGLQLLGLWVG